MIPGIVGGAIVGSAMDYWNTKKTNEANAAEAQKNREYQKWEFEQQMVWAREQQAYQTLMANTAHQREIADLKSAGLNPILSASGGQGSSTPNAVAGGSSHGGAQATMQKPNSVNTAIQGAMATLDTKQREANIRNTEADTLNKLESNTAIKTGVTATEQDIENKKLQNIRDKVLTNEKYGPNGKVIRELEYYKPSQTVRDIEYAKQRLADKVIEEISYKASNTARKGEKTKKEYLETRKRNLKKATNGLDWANPATYMRWK